MTAPNLKKSSVYFLLVTTFLFALGMSLAFPVLPFIVSQYVSDTGMQAIVISILGASYALLSFFSAPVMGTLSDLFGRRPVLMLALLGSAIGYVIFGIGGSLFMLFLGRCLDGLTAGGMGTLFAYVSDSTSEEDRGKVFGQIGATVGAGLIAGPALGGLLSHLSLSAPMYAAAAICLLNLLWGYFVLPESLPRERRSRTFDLKHLNPFVQLKEGLASPLVRRLVTVAVMFTLPFSLMQIAQPLMSRDVLHWDAAHVGTVFMVAGVCDIIVQGFLLSWLFKRWGEKGVAQTGLVLGIIGIIGMALLPLFPSVVLMYASVVLIALGEGVFNAALTTLISLAVPEDEQGRTQGGVHAMNELAQVVGPLVGGQLYSRFGASASFGTCAGLIVLALGVLTGTHKVSREPVTA
ncbi:MFS transporter [Deinococcus roseus]|uniref:Tetracycline resistance MFS efflux pump n=1 Tax=Deinococcus roseus TaxID=392414 RepID=A0ABQ2D0M8_9DEIO|nr:MFS transporter [Deinococcus roseus]GGJ35786.1 tetracycline resistance MFS efflux pump [Deinococcus roseus]